MSEKERKQELGKEIEEIITNNSELIFRLREITGASHDASLDLLRLITMNLL